MNRKGTFPDKSYLSLSPLILTSFLVCAAALYGCSGEGDKPAAGPAPKAAASSSPVPGRPPDIEAGKAIYNKYCHFCHGPKGLGDGPVGIAISPHPADFVNDTKRMSKTDHEIFLSITKGVHRDVGGEEMAMPRWQDILTENDRWDVIAYIRFLGREGTKSGQR